MFKKIYNKKSTYIVHHYWPSCPFRFACYDNNNYNKTQSQIKQFKRYKIKNEYKANNLIVIHKQKREKILNRRLLKT